MMWNKHGDEITMEMAEQRSWTVPTPTEPPEYPPGAVVVEPGPPMAARRSGDSW